MCCGAGVVNEEPTQHIFIKKYWTVGGRDGEETKEVDPESYSETWGTPQNVGSTSRQEDSRIQD